jgi:hypothetical protein
VTQAYICLSSPIFLVKERYQTQPLPSENFRVNNTPQYPSANQAFLPTKKFTLPPTPYNIQIKMEIRVETWKFIFTRYTLIFMANLLSAQLCVTSALYSAFSLR